MKRFLVGFAHVTVFAALIAAQASAPEFEVASIHLHKPPLSNIRGLTISGPRVTFEGYNLALLIIEAYHLKGNWQLSFASLPGRDDQISVYYDIAARAPDDGTYSRDSHLMMLRTLLAKRFKLSIHHENKQTPAYALTVGKKVSKLKESAGQQECSVHVEAVTGAQSYTLSNCAIDRLVDLVNNGLVDRPVVDRTGLTGRYDFRFLVTLASMRPSQSELSEISPYTAIEDLGLKLQAQVAPMDVIVVDHFEKPTAN